MTEQKSNEIPNAIKPYLNEIAERLWSDHATVMIGSGFSKNAKCSIPSSKGFPDWNQLGNAFYKKIHGCFPDDKKEKEYYLNCK